MGCAQGKAKKRIADIQKLLTNNRSFESKAKAISEKYKKSKKKNLFTIVEVASCHEESHDLST